MNRKYHSGLMPAGADANGSAFVPSSQGKNAASAARTARPTSHTTPSRSTKLGRKRSGLRVLRLLLEALRDVHPLALDERQVDAEQRRRDHRQHRDVEAEEAGQRRAGDLLAAAQEREQPAAPASGTLLTMSVPTRVAKNDSSFHGSR